MSGLDRLEHVSPTHFGSDIEWRREGDEAVERPEPLDEAEIDALLDGAAQ